MIDSAGAPADLPRRPRPPPLLDEPLAGSDEPPDLLYQQPHHIHPDLQVRILVSPQRGALRVRLRSNSGAPLFVNESSSISDCAAYVSFPHASKLCEVFQDDDLAYQSIARSVFVDYENSDMKLRLESVRLFPAQISSFGRKALLLHQVMHVLTHFKFFTVVFSASMPSPMSRGE